MKDNFREFLMIEYASRVAKSESMDFTKGYYKNKIKDLSWYDNNRNLMMKHQRFLNYIYSTFEKYIIHRNIIIYYYEKINCSISVLNNTVDISRTGLTRILILPTELRIEFWLLYCKSKYEKGKSAGLADAHKALFHYDKNLEKYIKDNKTK